jgi:hypothetical protein
MSLHLQGTSAAHTPSSKLDWRVFAHPDQQSLFSLERVGCAQRGRFVLVQKLLFSQVPEFVVPPLWLAMFLPKLIRPSCNFFFAWIAHDGLSGAWAGIQTGQRFKFETSFKFLRMQEGLCSRAIFLSDEKGRLIPRDLSSRDLSFTRAGPKTYD